MRHRVRRANGKGAVEDSQQEGHSVRPARRVVLVKGGPDKVVTGMVAGCCCQHDDGDHAANKHEECSDVLRVGDESVSKDQEHGRSPEDDEISNVDVKRLADVCARVVHGVHAYGYVA